MGNYILRRLVQLVIVSFVAITIIFFLLQLTPGGPFDQIVFNRSGANADYINRLNKMIGLDKPLPVRYWTWLTGLIKGDWGTSWTLSVGTPVLKLIWQRLGRTLILMVASLLISLGVGVFLGIFSAIRQYSKADYAVTAFSFFGLSMPTFWLGLMLILIFALQFKEWHAHVPWLSWLPYLPVAGIYDTGQEGNFLNLLKHLVLPAVTLSLIQIAGWGRFVRASVLEVLNQDYIRTARAKGLIEATVINKHALRNALIPLITVVALAIPGLFGGATITETIFAWAGIGRLFYDAITRSDWPIAQGILVIGVLLVILSNLLADVLYAVADPRISYS